MTKLGVHNINFMLGNPIENLQSTKAIDTEVRI